MISADATVTVKNGRISVLPQRGNPTGVARKGVPQPVWKLPSSSSIIPHTSYLSNNEVDKSSWAFVAKYYPAHLQAQNNWNANGQLNA